MCELIHKSNPVELIIKLKKLSKLSLKTIFFILKNSHNLELDPDHPGKKDVKYMERRRKIAKILFGFNQ